MKILVIDDDEQMRVLLRQVMEWAGYEVVEAESGEEALEKLKAQKDIRVALLDVMLPGIDGFEVCRRLAPAHAAEVGKVDPYAGPAVVGRPANHLLRVG